MQEANLFAFKVAHEVDPEKVTTNTLWHASNSDIVAGWNQKCTWFVLANCWNCYDIIIDGQWNCENGYGPPVAGSHCYDSI